MRLFRLTAACAAVLAAACVTEHTETTDLGGGTVPIVSAEPDLAWHVLADGAVVGIVIRYASADEAGHHWFSVQNDLHQELGLIDSVGRAFRRVPHERDLEPLGAGTVAYGAGRILRTTDAELQPVALDELRLEAGAPAPR